MHFTDPQLQRAQLMHCTKEQMELMAEVDSLEMSRMDCYIAVRGSDNITELSDVPAEQMALYEKYYVTPVHHGIRVPETRWVGLRYRTMPWRSFPAPVQKRLKTFYFHVCNLDYSRMEKAMGALVDLMNRTDKVHLAGGEQI